MEHQERWNKLNMNISIDTSIAIFCHLITGEHEDGVQPGKTQILQQNIQIFGLPLRFIS